MPHGAMFSLGAGGGYPRRYIRLGIEVGGVQFGECSFMEASPTSN